MAKVDVQASDDFWNCSRYSCAWPFCARLTLDDMVASAESTGAKASSPFIVAVAMCQVQGGAERTDTVAAPGVLG